MPHKSCKFCKNSFYARPTHLKKGWGKYCSAKCHYKDSRKGENLACKICEKPIYRNQQQLSRSKSKIYFCSKSCQTRWRNIQYVGIKHLNWKNGQTMYRKILLEANFSQTCMLCKEEDKRILAVHHADENHANYKIENLAWLCHNCHHLVHCDSVEKLKFISELKRRS